MLPKNYLNPQMVDYFDSVDLQKVLLPLRLVSVLGQTILIIYYFTIHEIHGMRKLLTRRRIQGNVFSRRNNLW